MKRADAALSAAPCYVGWIVDYLRFVKGGRRGSGSWQRQLAAALGNRRIPRGLLLLPSAAAS